MASELSPDDEVHLSELEGHVKYLRTCVQSVVEGYDTGLFIYGEGGIGKSFAVEGELKRLNAPFILYNTRLTTKGLAVGAAERPHDIHWIEDAEDALKQPHIDGLLRSLTYSQDDRRHPVRPIKWTLGKQSLDFRFTGGVIIVSNQTPEQNTRIARALSSRVTTIDFSLSQPQIIALMKRLCLEGYILTERDRFNVDDNKPEKDPWDVVDLSGNIQTMTPAECWGVATFIQDSLSEMNLPLSLRLIKQGWRDYLYAQNHPDQISWQDKLRGRMTQRPSKKYASRAEMVAVESDIARRIFAQDISYAEKEREWNAATGKSPAAFDRALKR